MMSIRNKQNSLAFKISLSFATVGLILIGALLHSILQIQRIDDRSENLLKLRTPITETSIDIIASTNQSMSALRDWFITEDDNYLVKQKQLWENNIKPDIASLNEFSLASLDEDNQFNVNVVVQNLNKLEKLQEQVIAAKKGNNTQAANVLLVDEAASTHQRIISQLEYSIDSQQSVVMSNLEKIRELIERLLITDWSFLIIGLLLCFIFGIIISKSLSRPINRLVKFALNLSKGNLEQEINITDSAEFQTLSEALNKMVSTFRGLANVTEDMAMGDYSHRVVVKSEQDRLALSTNQMLENFNQIVQQANAIAKGDYSLEIEPRSEHDVLGTALRNMTQTLNQNKVSNEAQNWLKDGVAELSTIISGQHNTEKLCGKAISTICRYLNAGVGAMYLMNDEQSLLQLMGTYAYTERQALANQFKIGEGIVGQVALENKAILLNTISEQECMINSGTSQEKPNYVYAMPISYESSLISVIEIAYNSPLTDIQKEYIKQIMPVLATQLQATKQQTLTTKLLKDSKLLTNQLQTQQEELKATNEELEQQTQILKSSEEELRLKDEQQQAINKKLEERTVELEKQKQQIEEKNIAVREAGDQLKKKNEELEAASQYKSEFLANMSHELRTPLNSLLILAKLLADNEEGNLDEEQVESAQIMYKSGQDLLALINDILDLAKVEAGKIDLHITSNVLQDFTDTINRDFTHVTTEKGIELITEIHGNLPDTIVTDDHRVHQIIRNLMSNAIKFTEQGHVKFSISRPDQSIDLSQSGLTADTAIAFAVQDTGIGIPEEKQAMVFNSFQQADGTTSRHYGGTGLGLSISTQLAELLGGQITLTSVPGKGSTFTLYLPEAHAQASQNYEPHYSQQDVVTKSEVQDVAEAFSVKVAGIPDDRDSISKKDHVLLIVEDDLQFTKILFSMCHKKGFKCLHSAEGGPGMALARQYQPSGILLDLGLPDMDGLTLLDKLKSDSNTQNIPVHIISASDQETKALQHGAIGYLTKPINQEQLEQAITQIEDNYETNIHDLLIVEDNKEMLQAMTKLLNNKNVNITGVQTGEDALQLLEGNHYDCVILDLGLPDISGQELLQRYHDNEHTDKPAVIIHTGKSLSEVENMSLETLADSIIIKGSTASMDRLIDETQAFLNRVVTSTPSKRQDSVKQADTSKKATKKLFNHKVLIVDDDMRNIFALSKSLKSKGINVIMAANGKTAIEALEAQPDIDAVLMDIMMPVMDGYEAISIIRQKQEFKELPIIALTAKAMKGDKEKCIEVGASDFLSKPLNIDELISKLQQWLVT